jgi:hypothetical protein
MGQESREIVGMRLEILTPVNIVVTFLCIDVFYANCNPIHLVNLSIAGVTESHIG